MYAYACMECLLLMSWYTSMLLIHTLTDSVN